MKRSIVKRHLDMLQFMSRNANDAQVEDMLFEISPDQLDAVRELVLNVYRYNPDIVTTYTEADGSRPKGIKQKKNFIQNLVSSKATRRAIRRNSSLVKHLITDGLTLYNNSDVGSKHQTPRAIKSKKKGRKRETERLHRVQHSVKKKSRNKNLVSGGGSDEIRPESSFSNIQKGRKAAKRGSTTSDMANDEETTRKSPKISTQTQNYNLVSDDSSVEGSEESPEEYLTPSEMEEDEEEREQSEGGSDSGESFD